MSGTTEDTRMETLRESRSSQSGLTLVETLIALFILGGGLLALAMSFSQGMVVMATSHYHQVAKEKASEAIESVSTSRDTRVIAWAQILNVRDGGIFLDGQQALRLPGPDGLANTSDDGTVEQEILPGPDGALGTGDDINFPMDRFTREIEIRDVAPNLRQIRVIVRYQIGHLARQYEVTTFISSFA
jgi:hypothetical protein